MIIRDETHTADLRGVDLLGADLRRADLRRANLRRADLRRANLRDADLRDADLRDADLRDADLRDTDLQGANLRDTDLQGANLQNARLQNADLRDARLPSPTIMLMAFWGDVSDKLTADLMEYDASCHPDRGAFDCWAAGGNCPYSKSAVQRAANFTERRKLWGKGKLCSPIDLVKRLLAEKCAGSPLK